MTIGGSFSRKQKRLGVSWSNYRQRQQELFRVRIDDTMMPDVHEWCDGRFGDEWIWSNPTNTPWADIYFLKEEDALLFKLSFDTIAV